MEQKHAEAQPEKESRELDLFAFLKYLLQKKHILIFAVVLGLAVSGIYVFAIAPPIYEATSQIYMVNSQDSVINLADLQIGSYLTSDYQWIFQTWEVNQAVIDHLNLPYTVTQMRNMLTVKNPNNTRVLTITFASTDPKEAADAANEYSVVASQYISESMLTSLPTTISVALEPLTPARPRKLLVMGVSGLLAGLIAMWGLFIAFLCDDKVKTAEDIQHFLGVMPLAVIPAAQSMDAENRGKQGTSHD